MQNLKQVKSQDYRSVFEGPINGSKKIVQIFNRPLVQSNNLEQAILFNQYILTDTNTKAFPNSFLSAQFQENEEVYILIQPHYEETLQNYIKKQTITQKEALQIFGQIIKSIYSLTADNLPHRNIRPEHFVLVNGVWKLRAAVWSNENYGIDNEYTLNSKYQAPEEYENESGANIDACQVIVWNLGSILLNMLMRTHILNNQRILNKFKNKQFSLKSIGSNKEISPEIQTYLSSMLHYNPEKRTKLDALYQNPQFSKQVSKHYKQNKTKVNQALKEVVRSSINSSLRGSVALGRSTMGSKMIPKSPHLNSSSRGLLSGPSQELIRSSMKLLEIDKHVSKQNLMISKRKSFGDHQTSIKQEEEFLYQLGEKTRVFINPIRKEEETDQSSASIDNDLDIKNIFSIYKTFIDRSELLCIAVNKFSEIPYEDKYREEFILMNEFSVYYVSLMQLHKIIQSINKNHNIYRISDNKFDEFLRSSNFKAYRQQVNELFKTKKQIFQYTAQKLINLPQKSKKLMRQKRFLDYVNERNFYDHSFANIKKPYRQILKMTYDKISVLYNTRKEDLLCRLSLYTVYCMTIDKLYIEEDLEDNFSLFIEWSTLRSTRNFQIDNKKHFTLSVTQLQRYFDTAPLKKLIQHSKKILRKYYKI